MDYFWFVTDLWSVSNQLQKRILRFLLKRTLGPFLYQDLALDQLDVTVGDLSAKHVAAAGCQRS